MTRLAVKLAIWLLERAKLSTSDRAELSTVVLDKLMALPLRDILTYDSNGSLLINGQYPEYEHYRLLRESARAMLTSSARKLIHDQVLFQAIKLGVHQVEKPDQLLFARAAIWWCQQEDLQLKALIGEEGELAP